MSKLRIVPQVRDNFKIDSLNNGLQNIGKITQEEANSLGANLRVFKYGSCKNLAALNIYWALNDQERIVDCKIEVFGDSELVAIASIAALVAKNKTSNEVLELKEKGIEYFLRENPNTPALPTTKRFLTNIIIDALYMCAKEYLNEEVEEGDIVDSFTGATMRYIVDTIKRYDITTLQDLIDHSGVGVYNKNCLYPGAGNAPSKYYLSDILKQTREEIEKEQKAASAVVDKPFEEMNNEEKRAAIEAIIDKNIRHMLVMDGGDMEILDIKQNGENTDIYIRYLGACSGCASASTGTLFAIEGILKQKLSDKIRVVPL